MISTAHHSSSSQPSTNTKIHITMNLSTLIFTLVFAILSTITAAISFHPVYDWKGEALRVDTLYDIWAVGKDRGPIAMGKPTTTQNQNYVIDRQYHPGPAPIPVPVRFCPANSSEPLVVVDRDHTILFDVGNKDPKSNVWKLNLNVGSSDHNFITTGGDYGTPGCWNFNSWFKIVPVDAEDKTTEHLYNIIFNPQVCASHKGRHCPVDITFYSKDGEDRLYLNQENFLNTPALQVNFVRHSSKLDEVI